MSSLRRVLFIINWHKWIQLNCLQQFVFGPVARRWKLCSFFIVFYIAPYPPWIIQRLSRLLINFNGAANKLRYGKTSRFIAYGSVQSAMKACECVWLTLRIRRVGWKMKKYRLLFYAIAFWEKKIYYTFIFQQRNCINIFMG